MQFAHEKLSVYQKALEFFDHAQKRIASWIKQHAFVDHLMRASESILFNLAEAGHLDGLRCRNREEPPGAIGADDGEKGLHRLTK